MINKRHSKLAIMLQNQSHRWNKSGEFKNTFRQNLLILSLVVIVTTLIGAICLTDTAFAIGVALNPKYHPALFIDYLWFFTIFIAPWRPVRRLIWNRLIEPVYSYAPQILEKAAFKLNQPKMSTGDNIDIIVFDELDDSVKAFRI